MFSLFTQNCQVLCISRSICYTIYSNLTFPKVLLLSWHLNGQFERISLSWLLYLIGKIRLAHIQPLEPSFLRRSRSRSAPPRSPPRRSPPRRSPLRRSSRRRTPPRRRNSRPNSRRRTPPRRSPLRRSPRRTPPRPGDFLFWGCHCLEEWVMRCQHPWIMHWTCKYHLYKSSFIHKSFNHPTIKRVANPSAATITLLPMRSINLVACWGAPLLHVAVAVRRDAANVKWVWGETTTEAAWFPQRNCILFFQRCGLRNIRALL